VSSIDSNISKLVPLLKEADNITNHLEFIKSWVDNEGKSAGEAIGIISNYLEHIKDSGEKYDEEIMHQF